MGKEFIRVGSSKVELRQVPEKERALWRLFDAKPVESDVARDSVARDEIITTLDIDAYTSLRELPTIVGAEASTRRLLSDELITANPVAGFDIPNATALLFARRLSSFPSLRLKALWIVVYEGKNRILARHEAPREIMDVGYATGFERFVAYIRQQVGGSEIIGSSHRHQLQIYPDKAIRELLANILIHQDLSIGGSEPMVEIFSDRIEFSNPGTPIVDTLRFVDEKRSRNERMAELMFLCRLCERRGSGVDRALQAIEAAQMPAPSFHKQTSATISTLFAPKPLSKMNKDEKVSACYLHACLQYVSNEDMTNASLRTRLGISEQNYSIASRIIADTISVKLIQPADPDNTSKRMSRYIPFWASNSMFHV